VGFNPQRKRVRIGALPKSHQKGYNAMSDEEIEINPSVLETFLSAIIQHEKRYAHNERGARNERRSKVVEKIEEVAARELDRV
jgi:hypothetical protein